MVVKPCIILQNYNYFLKIKQFYHKNTKKMHKKDSKKKCICNIIKETWQDERRVGEKGNARQSQARVNFLRLFILNQKEYCCQASSRDLPRERMMSDGVSPKCLLQYWVNADSLSNPILYIRPLTVTLGMEAR